MSENNLADSMSETMEEELKRLNEEEDPETAAEEAQEEPDAQEEPETSEEEGSEEETGEERSDEEGTEDPQEDSEESQEEEKSSDDDERIKQPPTTFRAQAKKDWDQTPESVKRDIHKREQDALKGLSQYKEQAEFGSRMNKTIEPYQAFINSINTTPDQVVKDALNLAYIGQSGTQEQKAQVVQGLAKQFGVDLGQVNQEQSGQEANDPVRQELNQLKQYLAKQEQQRQQQQVQSASSEVQEFASAVDDNGHLKHPYFENVREMMSTLIESGKAQTLEDAYEIAVWADPDTRQVMQSEQTSKAQSERQAAQKRNRAKKANKVNLDKKGSHEPASDQPTGTMDDTLRETLDSLKEKE